MNTRGWFAIYVLSRFCGTTRTCGTAMTTMEADIDTSKTVNRRSKRKTPVREIYVPAETIRSRATNPKKRSTTRYKKRAQPTSQKLSCYYVSAPFSKKPHQHTKAEHLFYDVVENTSLEIMQLMEIAIQLEQDFPDQVKIEFPMFRCESCFSFFPLKSYRQVRDYY